MEDQVYHMFGARKHKDLIWFVIISLFVTGCSDINTESSNESTVFEGDIFGKTQGTTYHIIFSDTNKGVTKYTIDSLLEQFDSSLSTYINHSVISQLNNGKGEMKITDETGFFKSCYLKSKEIVDRTDGMFDPSVFPLVKDWGFMKNVSSPLEQSKVDSILEFIGFNEYHEMTFEGDEVHMIKSDDRFKLDFNAIAQGYSVDVVDAFLAEKGYRNYYVEIGGELIARGINRSQKKWGIGIDMPKESSEVREVENAIFISNKAVATSGNYRKFYEKDGVKYAHSLNPKTGYPVQHSLLSVTVVAEDCATADAYATAFMVMGEEKTMDFLRFNEGLNLGVYLLVARETEGYTRTVNAKFEPLFNE